MKRFRSFFPLGFFVAISLPGGLMQGCCGMDVGPSASDVQRWIHKGDPADKAVSVLKERGFNLNDNQRAMYITGERLVDACIFTDAKMIVEVQLDENYRVDKVQVKTQGEGP